MEGEKEIQVATNKKESQILGIIGRTFEKNPWAVYLIVIITVVLLYLLVRFIVAKVKTAISSAPVPYQDGGVDVSSSWAATGDNLVNKLYSVISGYDWSVVITGGLFDERIAVFESMLPLSRDQRTYMYNKWKKLYQAKYDGKSMTQAIDDEYLVSGRDKQKALVNLLRNEGLQ